MKSKILFWGKVLWNAVRNFNRDDGWAIASHIALSSLFALFPFLIFATSIAAFFELSNFSEFVVHLIFDYWPQGAGEVIAKEMKSILTVPRSDALTIGGLLTLYFASNGVEAIRVALNRSYREKEKRSTLRLRAQSIFFVFIAILVLMIISFFLVFMPLAWQLFNSYLPESAPLLAAWSSTVWIWRFVIALAVLSLALILSHVYLPAGSRSITNVLPGVAFTLFCWMVGSIAFGAYLQQFADYVSTYAGLAGAMIGLIFLYMLGVFFIIGGEINAAFLQTRHKAEG